MAVGITTSLFVQLGGVSLPTALDAGSLFVAFVCTVTMLTVTSDYARHPRPARLPRSHRTHQAEIIPMQAPARLAA